MPNIAVLHGNVWTCEAAFRQLGDSKQKFDSTHAMRRFAVDQNPVNCGRNRAEPRNPRNPQGQQPPHSYYKYIYLLIGLSLDAWFAS